MENIATLDDIDLIHDDINDISAKHVKKAHTRTLENKRKIKVKSSYEVGRDNYKNTKKLINNRLRDYKKQVKYSKLTLRKAKLEYKLLVSNLSLYKRILLACHLY